MLLVSSRKQTKKASTDNLKRIGKNEIVRMVLKEPKNVEIAKAPMEKYHFKASEKNEFPKMQKLTEFEKNGETFFPKVQTKCRKIGNQKK